MKCAINTTGNRLDAVNSKLEEAEEWIGDLENTLMEINEAEQKRERRIMEHKNRLRELSDSIKCNDICIIGVPEEEEREKRDRTFI